MSILERGGEAKGARSMAAVKFEAILKGDPGDLLQAARALDAEDAANGEVTDNTKKFTAEGVADALSVFDDATLEKYLGRFSGEVLVELSGIVVAAKGRVTFAPSMAESERVAERSLGDAEPYQRAEMKAQRAQKVLEAIHRVVKGQGSAS